MRKFGRPGRGWFFALIAVGLLAPLSLKLNAPEKIIGPAKFSVVDGDSLALAGERFRMLGVDAPEFSQECWRDAVAWACGKAAREALVQLLAGKAATCRGSRRDRYDRLLVSCEAGGIDVNAQMVRSGMAVAFGDYQAEEADARAARTGIWSGTFQQPQDYRRAGRQAAVDDFPAVAVGSYFRRLVGWQ
jgi:endonuclease YncB( thermonuclease family)